MKGRISVTGTNNANKRDKKLTFKNSAPLRSCISEINNAEDLDIVTPMCNLLEYSENYFMTSGSLWIHYRDEVNDSANKDNDADNYRINNKITSSKSFEYKTKITVKTPIYTSRLDAEVLVSLKYLSTFWRSLHLPLINCEIELDLSW